MSCDSGSRSVAAGPAAGSGISALANKAAHFTSKASGVAVGMVAGAAGSVLGGSLGTLIAGPVGTVAGGIAGGVAGGYAGKIRYEKRQAALQERRWQQSAAGKKAVGQRDQALSKLKLDYREQNDKFKAQQQKIKDDYEQAKAAWLDKLPEKDVKNKAVAGSLATGS